MATPAWIARQFEQTDWQRLERVLDRMKPVLRWRYAILVVAAALFSVQRYAGQDGDWSFLIEGSERLFGLHRNHPKGAGGLHIYANYPYLQIGPLSFLLATPFRLFGASSRLVSVIVMTASAPAFVYFLERLARRVHPLRTERTDAILALTTLGGGLLLMEAWSPLVTMWGHLDDVLVLAFGCMALWAVQRQRPALLGAALGLAMAAKPWGIIFVPLAFAFPWRERIKAAVIGGAITLAAWLPFILADRGTLSAIRPTLNTNDASVLHLLFNVGYFDSPMWVRPVQLAGALVAGWLAVRRGRWGAVLLVGIAVRLLLDPGVFPYYSAGLILAGLAWDLLRSPRPWPFWTLTSWWLLSGAMRLPDTPEAIARLVLTLAIVVYVVLPRRSGSLERPAGSGTASLALAGDKALTPRVVA